MSLFLRLINILLANPVFVKYTESARKDENEVRAFPSSCMWYADGSSVLEKNNNFIGRERSNQRKRGKKEE